MAFLARAEAVTGKLDEAQLTLQAAENLLVGEEFPAEELPAIESARIRCWIENSRLFLLKNIPSQARNALGKAWSLAVPANADQFTVEIAQLMAVVDPPKRQEEWLRKAIEIGQSSPHPKARERLAQLRLSLAWKFFDLRQFEQALACLREALDSLPPGAKTERHFCRWSIGRTLRALNREEEALTVQKKLLLEAELDHEPDGRVFEEMAECLQALSRTQEAQGYFEQAYNELSKKDWVKDHHPLKLKRLKDLGKVR